MKELNFKSKNKSCPKCGIKYGASVKYCPVCDKYREQIEIAEIYLKELRRKKILKER